MDIKRISRSLGIQHHPFRKRYLAEYLFAFILPLEKALADDDKSEFIFIFIISILFPPFIFIIPIRSLFRANHHNACDARECRIDDIRQVVLSIQLGHHQTLSEALKREPALALAHYKNHSMNYWCKKYKNPKAHSIILRALQK